MMEASLGSYWRELVTVALLGTDRRDPPPPPPGPIADVVADTARTAPSERMLATVAACTAVRRAGLLPLPPAPPLAAPAPDRRPVVPDAAVARWRTIVDQWPVLEDEWLDAVAARGWRASPDLTVELLRRHRGGPRRDRAERVAGPVATWLVAHRPELGPMRSPVRPEAHRAELPLPPDLLDLLLADERTIASTVSAGFNAGHYGAPHRAVLVNFVARLPSSALPRVVEALRSVDPNAPAAGFALLLADLGATRDAMLADLGDHP